MAEVAAARRYPTSLLTAQNLKPRSMALLMLVGLGVV
jgi:hypothetical protein